MATTAPELLEWLGQNQLLSAARVEELRPQLSAWPDAHALAQELVHRNWLTPYQVNQILQDKGDTLIVGPNRLLERIGEGAMGQIYKAWHTRLARIVAVKMIHKQQVANAKAMDRFRREVETAQMLDHPNIVLVREAAEVDGRPYMVMDFIDGEDLSRRVKQRGPLPVAAAAEYARQAALGLQHALERGVVHRDIKPSNLMLLEIDSPPTKHQTPNTTHHSSLTTHQVKILDFGLARFESETRDDNRLTQLGSILGTVDYIAPEQAQDPRNADVRADIYGLGCTLFFLLAGKPPFAGTSAVDKITTRMINPPPSVRAERSDVPAALDAVVQRMMARRPEDRYQTPMEIVQALVPFAQPPLAVPGAVTPEAGIAPAARTASVLAQAIPMAQPIRSDSPLPLAYPVGLPVATRAAPLPQAFPVPSKQTPEEIPVVIAALPMSDGGAEAIPIGISLAVPVAETPRPQPVPLRRNQRLGLYLGGAAVGIVGLVILMVAFKSGSRPATPNKQGYGPGASLHVLPIPPIVCEEGQRKPIIVNIERKGFYGPVRVRLVDLPDHVRAQEITLTDKEVTSQFMLTVSYNIGASKKIARLVATAENLQDSIAVPITVVPLKN